MSQIGMYVLASTSVKGTKNTQLWSDSILNEPQFTHYSSLTIFGNYGC